MNSNNPNRSFDSYALTSLLFAVLEDGFLGLVLDWKKNKNTIPAYLYEVTGMVLFYLKAVNAVDLSFVGNDR